MAAVRHPGVVAVYDLDDERNLVVIGAGTAGLVTAAGAAGLGQTRQLVAGDPTFRSISLGTMIVVAVAMREETEVEAVVVVVAVVLVACLRLDRGQQSQRKQPCLGTAERHGLLDHRPWKVLLSVSMPNQLMPVRRTVAPELSTILFPLVCR